MKFSSNLLQLEVDSFPEDFDFYNDQFPPLDALTYWHFLKKAKRVIEIGCGYSTSLAWKSGAKVVAIDPQPRVFTIDIPYILKPIQDVDPSIFSELKENDILFIDSSHIYTEGSDVWYVINKIIPNLKKGVLIHFHDYFGDYGYPQSWQEHPEMCNWNENTYVIELSKQYEILAFNYEISKIHNEERISMYPFVPKDITQNMGAIRGASLWLKK